MRRRTVVSLLILALLYLIPASAQEPKAGKNANPGVNPVRLMDRQQVRVTRVEIQPGAVRSVHQHDDVRFHLFIPLAGKIELTIGSAKPLEAVVGQSYFMEKGTPHGFRNTGSTLAMVMEVFVKDGATVAQNAR